MTWQEWVMNMLQANEGMNQAVKHFYLTSDKEIANMAAFAAMGQDPNNAPRFWAPRPSPAVNITNMSNKSDKTVNWPAIIAVVVALAAIGFAIYSMTNQEQRFLEARQQIQDKVGEVRQKIKPAPSALPPLTAEICEELDSDPIFKAEIEKDVAMIAQKVFEHRKKRLGQ